jgi:hypothetical protein
VRWCAELGKREGASKEVHTCTSYFSAQSVGCTLGELRPAGVLDFENPACSDFSLQEQCMYELMTPHVPILLFLEFFCLLKGCRRSDQTYVLNGSGEDERRKRG